MKKILNASNIKMLKIAAVPTVICICVALLLSVVNALTSEKIEENLKAAEQGAIAEIFGDGIQTEAITELPDGVKSIFEITKDGQTLGWCVGVSPNGFGGNINMVVGVGTDGKIIGVSITSLSETPGLGSRVADPEYLKNYIGKGLNLHLKSDVDGISGATISSRSVLAGVNTATDALVCLNLIEEGKN